MPVLRANQDGCSVHQVTTVAVVNRRRVGKREPPLDAHRHSAIRWVSLSSARQALVEPSACVDPLRWLCDWLIVAALVPYSLDPNFLIAARDLHSPASPWIPQPKVKPGLQALEATWIYHNRSVQLHLYAVAHPGSGLWFGLVPIRTAAPRPSIRPRDALRPA